MEIKEEERIDDLDNEGLKIIQKKNGFCFGMDSILLSNFAKGMKKNAILLDLGSGTGILSILLSKRSECKKIYAVEIQQEMAEMINRSIKMNHLEEKICVINEDIRNLLTHFEKQSVDVIVTNPPYKKIKTGIVNENKNKLVSRHEIEGNLEDFINITYQLLKDHGELYMVHRPERLADIIEILRRYKIEPKNIRFVYPRIDRGSNLLLIRAVKNGKEFLKIEEPLIIYKENGEYTEELIEIYE